MKDQRPLTIRRIFHDIFTLMFEQNCSPRLNGEVTALKSETVETLEAAALQLTPADRASLVDRLIVTLDADPDVEEVSAAEVEGRQTEIEHETVTLLPGPESLAKLKAEFE